MEDIRMFDTIKIAAVRLKDGSIEFRRPISEDQDLNEEGIDQYIVFSISSSGSIGEAYRLMENQAVDFFKTIDLPSHKIFSKAFKKFKETGVWDKEILDEHEKLIKEEANEQT